VSEAEILEDSLSESVAKGGQWQLKLLDLSQRILGNIFRVYTIVAQPPYAGQNEGGNPIKFECAESLTLLKPRTYSTVNPSPRDLTGPDEKGT
jgi:hypothetical protein